MLWCKTTIDYILQGRIFLFMHVVIYSTAFLSLVCLGFYPLWYCLYFYHAFSLKFVLFFLLPLQSTPTSTSTCFWKNCSAKPKSARKRTNQKYCTRQLPTFNLNLKKMKTSFHLHLNPNGLNISNIIMMMCFNDNCSALDIKNGLSSPRIHLCGRLQRGLPTRNTRRRECSQKA